MSFDCIRSVRAARACNFYHVTDEPDEPSRPSVLGARTMLRNVTSDFVGEPDRAFARGSEGARAEGSVELYRTADP